MNFIQNQAATFSIKNCVIALVAMITLGVLMVASGVQNSLTIAVISSAVVIALFKVFDVLSAKQEATAQADASAFQQATVVSITDYRSSVVETEVAA